MFPTLVDLHICQRLPLVHCYHPFPINLSAAQVNDELFRIIVKGSKYCLETVGRKSSFRKEVGGHNDLLNNSISLCSAFLEATTQMPYFFRSSLNPHLSILRTDPSSYLQSAGPRFQRFASGFFISWTQHNDVSSMKCVLSVEARKMTGGPLGDVVGSQLRRYVRESPSNNLLDLPRVQIDARPKPGHCQVAIFQHRLAEMQRSR